MKSWLAKLVEESPGVPSSMRVTLLLVTLAVVLVLLVLSACVAFGELDDIPGGVITLCTLVFTGAATTKVIQHRNE